MINWDRNISTSFSDGNRAHRFSLETRQLGALRPHEKPSSWRIWSLAKAMRANHQIPLISIADDGTILDGHARWYAARRVGGDVLIPVEVKRID
jgi:hypothetical protein